MKQKVALIFGGRSAEHEVSMKSARNIEQAIDLNKFDLVLIGISKQGSWFKFKSAAVFTSFKSLNDADLGEEEMISLMSFGGQPTLFSLRSQEKTIIDCAFPIVHGTMGEDGTLQGYFKIVNLPFVGCSVLSSAIGMDKDYMKRIMTEAGIQNAKSVTLYQKAPISYKDVTAKLGSPFFIKPANAGSSVGVHKVKNESDYQSLLKDSFLYDHKVLAEEFVEGREVECAVMGLNQSAKASVPGELIIKHEFYSYEAKYLDENGAEIIIPARLEQSTINEIQKLAIKTFQVLGCDGLTRVDFFLKKNGDLYVNEINTLPGFTQISMYPKMWEATGLKYESLITELIELAFQKHSADSALKLDF